MVVAINEFGGNRNARNGVVNMAHCGRLVFF